MLSAAFAKQMPNSPLPNYQKAYGLLQLAFGRGAFLAAWLVRNGVSGGRLAIPCHRVSRDGLWRSQQRQCCCKSSARTWKVLGGQYRKSPATRMNPQPLSDTSEQQIFFLRRKSELETQSLHNEPPPAPMGHPWPVESTFSEPNRTDLLRKPKVAAVPTPIFATKYLILEHFSNSLELCKLLHRSTLEICKFRFANLESILDLQISVTMIFARTWLRNRLMEKEELKGHEKKKRKSSGPSPGPDRERKPRNRLALARKII